MRKCQSRTFTCEIFAQQFQEVSVSSALHDNATKIAEKTHDLHGSLGFVPLFTDESATGFISLVILAILHAIFPSCFHGILFRGVYFSSSVE